MTKRLVAAAVLPLTVLVLAPAPALARDHADETAEMARQLENPHNQEAVADAMGATIGDLVGPEARQMPREIKRRVPGMMTAMASMTGMLGEMMPQLEAIGDKLEHDLDRAD